jgi:hypothetical protein
LLTTATLCCYPLLLLCRCLAAALSGTVRSVCQSVPLSAVLAAPSIALDFPSCASSPFVSSCNVLVNVSASNVLLSSLGALQSLSLVVSFPLQPFSGRFTASIRATNAPGLSSTTVTEGQLSGLAPTLSDVVTEMAERVVAGGAGAEQCVQQSVDELSRISFHWSQTDFSILRRYEARMLFTPNPSSNLSASVPEWQDLGTVTQLSLAGILSSDSILNEGLYTLQVRITSAVGLTAVGQAAALRFYSQPAVPSVQDALSMEDTSGVNATVISIGSDPFSSPIFWTNQSALTFNFRTFQDQQQAHDVAYKIGSVKRSRVH